MISKCPAAVLDSGWGGGGLDRGEIIWPGMTSWMAGVAVAVSSNVYCCGVSRVESSAKPHAASVYAAWAVLKLEKTSPIFSQMDNLGKLFPGNLHSIASVIVLRSGILDFDGTTFGLGDAGFRHVAIVVISFNSLSATVSMTVRMLAKRARFQTATRDSQYAVT